MCKVWVRNRSPVHFYHTYLPIIEHSVMDTLKLTSELESRQNKKKKKKKSGFLKNEVSSLILRLSNWYVNLGEVHVFCLFLSLNLFVHIGCTTHNKAGLSFSFHRFPHSKPALLQNRTQAVKNPPEKQMNIVLIAVYILSSHILKWEQEKMVTSFVMI